MGKRLALVVGVSKYGEGFEPLPGSLRDLQAMEAALKDQDCGAFEVAALSNCDRASLETQIEQFFQGRDQDDLLLFYFSGHGDLGSGGMLHQHLHFCTHNTRKEQGRLVESSALSAGFLKRQMDLSRAQQMVVILDCCYSGAIADLLKKGEGDIDFGELKAKGRVILAASSATQVALQATDGLSLYTRYLLEGMTGAAYPGQGDWIAARDLHNHAERRFEIENKGYPPKIIAEDTGYNLPIVRAPKPDPKLEYRKEVDRIFRELDQELNLDFNGVIEDDLDRGSLETRRQRLGLELAEAEAIEKEIQQPYLVRAVQRQSYADYFQKACKDGFLPTERARRRLAEIRQNLALGEADAERIEQRIMRELKLSATRKEILQQPQEQTIRDPKYQQLEELLKTQQWRKADEETYRLMITTVGKEVGQYFDPDDLENFPCQDLQTIDQLWVEYSNGKWGFSVQKQIWQECGSPMDYNTDWKKFADRVGWRKQRKWLNYSNLTFDLQQSLKGEFPGVGGVWCFFFGVTVVVGNDGCERRVRFVSLVFSSLAQRLVNCSTSQS